jgi:hypothetical protein
METAQRPAAHDQESNTRRGRGLARANSSGLRSRVVAIVVPGTSATLDAIGAELVTGCTGLLGMAIPASAKVRHHPQSGWLDERERLKDARPIE